MFSKRNPKHIVSEGSKSLLDEQILNLKAAQDEALFKVQTKRIYCADVESYPVLDFSKSQKIRYIDNLYLRDLTTDEQIELGISILHVSVKDTMDSLEHVHKNKYQLAYVIKGEIINLISGITYSIGETMFIEKQTEHSIRYTKDSELILISIPGLDVISNTNNFIKNTNTNTNTNG